jgi:TBC1 domain family protein 5
VLDADYTAALSLLLHYSLPPSSGGSAGLVKDGVYLDANRSFEAGATLIRRYSNRTPDPKTRLQPNWVKRGSPNSAVKSRGNGRSRHQPAAAPSPSRLSARFLSQQKGLEALFQEVSGEVQRRTEGWSIARAVKGAVGEVRRNVQNLQPETRVLGTRDDQDGSPNRNQEVDTNSRHILTQRVQELEDRNKALARMLGTTLESLRVYKQNPTEGNSGTEEENFNIILAKLQFVQVYLADPEIPIPAEEPQRDHNNENDEVRAILPESAPPVTEKPSLAEEEHKPAPIAPDSPNPAVQLQPAMPVQKTRLREKEKAIPRTDLPPRRQQRPSLADSSFSFMLGEGRHRSSFVSSASEPPEQRRGSDPKSKPKPAVAGEKEVAAQATESEEDGFTMSSLRGFEKR